MNMGWSANIGGGLYTANDFNQEELWKLPPAQDAARMFQTLLRTSLRPFVGEIKEVFGPPKSVGLHFEFAPGKRDEFVRTVDPEALAKTMSLAMRPEAPKSPLIPDDQGRKDANWVARRQAARNGLGISFRQEGIGSSLHVAYDETDCDVHVDRNGFVIRRANGKVHWDLNGLLRHLTVDLIPDRAPWAAASIGYRDKQQRPLMKATISPWVAVDLPSRENEGQVELKIGVLFKGTFDAL
jgi:hypothetical protein